MKYLAVLAAALFVLGGCSSPSQKEAPAGYKSRTFATAHAEGIMDDEYDVLVAPEYDYETDVAYEVQIRATETPKQNAKKPTAKPKAVKQ
jgi:hypothetical protein